MYTVNESLLFLKLKSHFNLVLLKFKRHPCQEIITIYNLLLLCIFFITGPNHTLMQLRLSQAGDSR